MIEISTYLDQDCIFQEIAYGSGFSLGPTPARQITVGGFSAYSGVGGRPLVADTTTASLGFVVEDDRAFGALRDKGVKHLNAKGSVVLCSMVRSLGKYPNTSASRFIYSGENYSIGNAAAVNYLGVAPVGMDLAVSQVLPIPSYTDSVNRTIRFAPVTVSGTLKWLGNAYVVEQSISDATYTVNAGPTQYSVPGYALCTFGYVIPASGMIMRSAPQGVLLSAGKYGSPLVGPNRSIGALLPDLNRSKLRAGTLCTLRSYTRGSGYATVLAVSVKDIIASTAFRQWVQRGVFYPFTSESYDYGQLGDDIIKQCKYVDANILLTVFDLIRLRSDLESWDRLAKSLTFSKDLIKYGKIKTIEDLQRWLYRVTKSGSSAYLGVIYGALPTIRDGQRLLEGLGTLSAHAIPDTQRVHARRSYVAMVTPYTAVTSTYTLTAEVQTWPGGYGAASIMDHIRDAKKWGVWPTFSALWDFVPFSFCIDWVNPLVGNTAKYADGVVDRLYFPVDYCVYSVKRTLSPLMSEIFPYGWGATGSVTFSYYERWCSHGFPPPQMQSGDGALAQFSHWAEASALIIQRRK